MRLEAHRYASPNFFDQTSKRYARRNGAGRTWTQGRFKATPIAPFARTPCQYRTDFDHVLDLRAGVPATIRQFKRITSERTDT